MAQWHLLTALHRTLSDNSRTYLSKQELCEKIECTPVTFDRLIKILREEFGAPLINSRKFSGYKYDLKDGDAIELLGMWFKTDELEALICLEGIASSLQKGYLSEAFKSFKSRLVKLLIAQDIELKDWQQRFSGTVIMGVKIPQHREPELNSGRKNSPVMLNVIKKYDCSLKRWDGRWLLSGSVK